MAAELGIEPGGVVLHLEFWQARERLDTALATPREALLIGTNPALSMLLVHRCPNDRQRRSVAVPGRPVQLRQRAHASVLTSESVRCTGG